MLKNLKIKYQNFKYWWNAVTHVRSLEKQLACVERQITQISVIMDRTERKLTEMEVCDIDVSASRRSQHTIVLTGRYKNRGYVRFFDIGQDEFNYFVKRMEQGNKDGYYRNIDSPPALKASFKWA